MNRSQEDNTLPADQTELLGIIEVKPRQPAELVVGIYESCIPEPELKVHTTPDVGDDLGVSLARIEGQGDYTLVYHFQNFGNQACRAVVTG